jgi:hypothetical protein
MRPYRALGAALVVLTLGRGSVHATPLMTTHSSVKPSLAIRSVAVSGHCVSVKVAVQHFTLVKPNFAHPKSLKGNAGHIRYHLSGPLKLNVLREVTASTSFRWCGAKDGVRPGQNIIQVYLVTSGDTLFPGTMPAIRIVRVR